MLSDLKNESLTHSKNTPYGLGFVLLGKKNNIHIAKLGQNAGYQGWLVAYPATGQGAVVITNSDNGREFAQDIIFAISKTYQWPTSGKLVDAWMLNE